MISATPTAPYGISLLSSDGSSMTVGWKSPKHCGGSKVNAYYIDHRNADTLVWKEVNLAPITERVYTVSHVNRDFWLEFVSVSVKMIRSHVVLLFSFFFF